ncbi:uncharacterized protein [Montipora foliosa]|uniref:uncharacterized protein n=1 Tax=Montipora foliosa TaxID=591990 RepID=UPI0035F1CA40
MKIYLVEVLISLSLCVEQTLLESIEIRRFIGEDEDSFYIPRTVCDLDSRYEQFCASGHDLCESCEINNLFHNEDKIEPLRVLSKTEEEQTKLNKKECYISPDISWYIGCDGKRETLKANQLQTSFGLEWNQGRRKAYFLKVLDDSYQGQIIKLGIRCPSGLPGYNNSCLLFKVQGNFSCPLGKQETDKLFSTTAALAETTSTPSKMPRETSTQTKQSSTEGRFQPSSGVRQTDDSSSKVPVIVGVTASIIFTIVLLVVAFLICRRYKSRQEKHESKKKVMGWMLRKRNPTANSETAMQDYGIPSWEDQDDKGPVYAVIAFPEKHSKDEKKEPFHCVVEEAALIDKETDRSGASKNPKSEKHFNEDHIYAEVKNRKKRRVENSLKLPDFINLIENSHSGSSEDETGPVLEILGPYVRGAQEPDLPEFTPEKPVYFTLEECFSHTLKRTNDDLECGDGPIFRLVGGPDQYRAICTEALVYYTLNESEQDDENDNNSKFTIGQVFDELEERFLNKDGEPGSTNPERPEHIPEKSYTGRQLANASEPVYNFLEELFPKGTPTFSRGTIRNEDGPIYFHLRRLKSNHSKATRIQPKWRDVEDENPTGADGNKKTNPVYTRAPAFNTLERSDYDKQNDGNDMFTIEEAFDQLQDRYLKNPEEAKNASLERPGLVPQARSSNDKLTGDSEGTGEPGNKVLGKKETLPFQLLSNHDGPVYLHLRRLKSNHSKATRIRPQLENEGECGGKEGQDNTDKVHHENVPIYARAPVFYTLKRSGIEKQNNNNTLVTIEQAFDELKDRYFEKPEGARNSDPKNASVHLQKDYLDSEQTKNSIAEPKPMLNLLEQVRGQETSKFQSLSDHDGPVYLHLRRLKSNHSKATRIRPRLEGESECSAVRDQTRKGVDEDGGRDPIYARAPVFYTLKRSGSDKQAKENNLVTIEQAFNQLEDRYLKKQEEAENSSLEGPSLMLKSRCLDRKGVNYSAGTSEPVLNNIFDEVCGKEIQTFSPISNYRGPIYFNLRRLKSNHSRATRIQSEWEDEPVYSVIEEKYLKGTEGKDTSKEEPIYLTLEQLCSDTLKRDTSDSQDEDELDDDIFVARYLESTEDADSSARPVFYSLDTFRTKKFARKSSNESLK